MQKESGCWWRLAAMCYTYKMYNGGRDSHARILVHRADKSDAVHGHNTMAWVRMLPSSLQNVKDAGEPAGACAHQPRSPHSTTAPAITHGESVAQRSEYLRLHEKRKLCNQLPRYQSTPPTCPRDGSSDPELNVQSRVPR
ncbi:hypothetical protein Bbelb_372060 [Branchiostoma belcheri]|nr:hypothetical protein Bbelb_372060 [Branchiostoma belcheri]